MIMGEKTCLVLGLLEWSNPIQPKSRLYFIKIHFLI